MLVNHSSVGLWGTDLDKPQLAALDTRSRAVDTTFALPVQLTVLTLQARSQLLVVAAPPRTAWHHPTTVEDSPLSLQPG